MDCVAGSPADLRCPTIWDRLSPRLTSMVQLLLQFTDEPTNELCALCGQHTLTAAGTKIVLAGTSTPICQECGRQHAPSLVALVDLAETATRISRVVRHSVFPPLTALLDLASAAEKYAQSAAPSPG
jgi:hypothetical protein